MLLSPFRHSLIQGFIPRVCGDFMKKLSLLLAILMLVACLCACENSKEEPTTTTTAPETTTDEVVIRVKKTLLVDVDDFIDGLSKYEGITVTTTDELVLLTMTGKSYASFIEQKHSEAVQSYNEILAKEDTYVEKFDYDENFRDVKVYVNRSRYDAASHDSYEFVDYVSIALAYQMYLPNGQQTKITILYSDNEEVISTDVLPITVDVR